jgi:glycosyltransferase involved in cell wall biosynthesis
MQVSEKKQPVILQVLPELRSGGVERGTIEVARAIAKAGGKSLIASQGGPMILGLKPSEIEHITLPLATKNPLKIWRNRKLLEAIIKKYNVDIVHVRSRAPAWSAWLACQKTGCRFMSTFHGTYGIKGLFKKRYNSIMTRGERVIAISHFISDHIQANYPVTTEHIRIIHRGVDLRLFNPFTHSPQRMIELSKEWRLPDELPLILFPGRITRWKGQDIFLRALAALPHRHFFAIILGDDKKHGKYRHELETLITELGLEGHVRIASHTRYISEAYLLARFVVATSLEPEAFGRVVLEAQAMGKPVITTDHGGPKETVTHDVNGWLIPPNNVQVLSDFLGYALSLDDDAMHWMAEQCVASARNFTMESMCQKTLDVYSELLNETTPLESVSTSPASAPAVVAPAA